MTKERIQFSLGIKEDTPPPPNRDTKSTDAQVPYIKYAEQCTGIQNDCNHIKTLWTKTKKAISKNHSYNLKWWNTR